MNVRGLMIIAGLDLVVVAAAAYLWTNPVRSWPEPAAVMPDIGDSLVVTQSEGAAIDLTRLTETIDRPLFVATRRPPPPPAPEAPPPAKDPLEGVKISGLFVSKDGRGGVIVQVEGKLRRVLTGESIGAWQLAQINGRDVKLTKDGGETATLHLGYAPQPSAPTPVAAAGQSAGNPNTGNLAEIPSAAGGAPAVGGISPAAMKRIQDGIAKRQEYLKAVAAARKANVEAQKRDKKE